MVLNFGHFMPLYLYVLEIQQLSPSCLLDRELQLSDFKVFSENESVKIVGAFPKHLCKDLFSFILLGNSDFCFNYSTMLII